MEGSKDQEETKTSGAQASSKSAIIDAGGTIELL
jgi:hypothetical protein